jgi:hypothetical protein
MSDTSTSATASGRTGATCPISGPYKSNRNARVTVFFKRGQRFPADADGAATTWTLVTPTAS